MRRRPYPCRPARDGPALGERSIGHKDPGATSTGYLLVACEAAKLSRHRSLRMGRALAEPPRLRRRVTTVTVGLVLVSHSKELAQGLSDVAGQMAPAVTIAPAGGLEDGEIGTSLT